MTKRKRLLILIWNLGVGGMQKRVKDIVKDISNNRPEWEVYLLVKYKSPRCFNQEIEKLPRVFVRYFPEKHFIYNKWASFPWILREYLIIRPNVCLTFLSHFSILMILARFLVFWRRCRVVLNEGVYTSKFLPIHSSRPKLEKKLIRRLYRFSDSIIVPTKAIERDLTENFLVPSGLIKHIPNWTLIPPQNPLKPEFDLIYAGRFEKEKNLFEMLQILKAAKKNYPKVKLCLIGEGSLELELRRKVDQLGLTNNVSFVLPQSDITPWLRRSKIFILTTLNEGLPNVILEAAMCKVPTVAVYFDGTEEVITHGKTGYITRTKTEMVQQILYLLDHEDFRRKIGENAQQFVKEKFTNQNQGEFIEILFDSMLAKPDGEH